MFNKFFGKKNDGFYMQVDEAAPPKAAVTPKEATKVAAPKADIPKAEVAAKSDVVSDTTVVTATTEAPAEQKSKSAKTSIKKDKKQEKKEDEPAASAEVVTVAPVAAAFTNFATDYLVTPAIAGNRRRPGANMKGFMSMARDVKEMKKGSQGSQQKAKAAKKTET
jgi:hypothetical protein